MVANIAGPISVADVRPHTEFVIFRHYHRGFRWIACWIACCIYTTVSWEAYLVEWAQHVVDITDALNPLVHAHGWPLDL